MWGIDMIGLINSKTSNGYHFIWVAINYFTKWIEVTSYAIVIAKNVAKFIKKDIIAWYGVLESIIIYNELDMNNKLLHELLS